MWSRTSHGVTRIGDGPPEGCSPAARHRLRVGMCRGPFNGGLPSHPVRSYRARTYRTVAPGRVSVEGAGVLAAALHEEPVLVARSRGAVPIQSVVGVVAGRQETLDDAAACGDAGSFCGMGWSQPFENGVGGAVDPVHVLSFVTGQSGPTTTNPNDRDR